MGVGFTEAMEGVEKDMESTLPTDFKLHMNSVVTGGEASSTIFVFLL